MKKIIFSLCLVLSFSAEAARGPDACADVLERINGFNSLPAISTDDELIIFVGKIIKTKKETRIEPEVVWSGDIGKVKDIKVLLPVEEKNEWRFSGTFAVPCQLDTEIKIGERLIVWIKKAKEDKLENKIDLTYVPFLAIERVVTFKGRSNERKIPESEIRAILDQKFGKPKIVGKKKQK